MTKYIKGPAVNYIECNNLPTQEDLLPNSLYVVKNKKVIVHVDKDKTVRYLGLLNSELFNDTNEFNDDEKLLIKKSDGSFKTLTKSDLINLLGIIDEENLQNLLNNKQNKLSSGNNIKTLNEQSLLGSGNIQIDGLASSYPAANTPLADDDKFIVRQGSDWKEVDKSELGGGGGADTIALTFTLRTKIDKNGYYTYPNYVYGITGTSWSNVTSLKLLDLMANGVINGVLIPKDYALSEVLYAHRKVSQNYDINITFYKNKIIDNSTINADGEVLGILNITGSLNKKTVKKLTIANPVKFKDNEQFIFVFNSNNVLSSNATIDEVEITAIFNLRNYEKSKY